MTEAKSLPTIARDTNVPSSSARTVARCACGHDYTHPSVAPEPVYTDWGWLLFLIGVTAKPQSVIYRCIFCKRVLASTKDPSVLRKFD